jgi:hypothetical protein
MKFKQRFVPLYHGFLNKLKTIFGNPIAISDANSGALQGLRIFGKSTQDGTPTPDTPVEIVSVENPTVNVCGKNLCKALTTQTLTTQGITITATQNESRAILNGVATAALSIGGFKNIKLLKGIYTVSVFGLNNIAQTYDRLYLIDSNDSKVVVNYIMNGSPKTFEITEDSVLSVDFVIAEGSSYNNQEIFVQIENGDTATEYEPYKAPQSLAVSTPNGLLGIPVISGGNYTDANGQRWICDEVDFERGVYVQRVHQKTFDGTEQLRNDWFPIAVFNVENPNLYAIPSVKPLCNYFTNAYIGNQGGSTLAIGGLDKLGFTNISEMQTFMLDCHRAGNPVVIQYALATPIETPLTAAQIEAYKSLHTNEPNTTISNDQNAWMEVKYISK